MILTYAWDCLPIAPLPGPRRPAHFTDLEAGATLTTWLTEPCSAAKTSGGAREAVVAGQEGPGDADGAQALAEIVRDVVRPHEHRLIGELRVQLVST